MQWILILLSILALAELYRDNGMYCIVYCANFYVGYLCKVCITSGVMAHLMV